MIIPIYYITLLGFLVQQNIRVTRGKYALRNGHSFYLTYIVPKNLLVLETLNGFNNHAGKIRTCLI